MKTYVDYNNLSGISFCFIRINPDAFKKIKEKNSKKEKGYGFYKIVRHPSYLDDIGDTYKVKWGEFNYTFKPEISGYWVFLMPKDKKPVQMEYSYQYREELPKSQEIKIGQIDIKL